MNSEGTVDLQELEKLRSTKDDLNRKESLCEDEQAQKWRILLEPALVGAIIAINLGQTSLQNFYLWTACTVDLNKTAEICGSGVGEEFREAEVASQQVVSSVNVGRSFVGSFIATIVLLFVGPWSDCSGRRKPLLILPLVGMSIMTTGVLLMLIFPGASTVQVLYSVQLPISLGGSFGLLLAASFSHIGDVCFATGRDVTRTMGTHRASIQIGNVVGAVCGPQLYRHLGFFGVFPLVLLLQLSSLAYVIYFIKDVNINADNKVSVFNWKLPLNAVQCLLRPREGKKRTIIILMLIVAMGDRKVLSADVLLSYMYYRSKFHWDDVMYGSFLAYRNIVSFLGTLLILSVFKRRLKLSDEAVGMLSCMSYVLATSGLIVSVSTLFVFLTAIVGVIAQGSQVVQRPILNRQILSTEQGKIYSVLGALESAVQTLSSPLYSLLYANTVSTFVDAWLLPGITLAFIQLLAYFLARKLGRKTSLDANEPKVSGDTKKVSDSESKTDDKIIINSKSRTNNESTDT